jgi:chromosome segregation ATPase
MSDYPGHRRHHHGSHEALFTGIAVKGQSAGKNPASCGGRADTTQRKKPRTSDQTEDSSDATTPRSPVSSDADDSGPEIESPPTPTHNGTQHRTLDDDEAIERAANLIPARRTVNTPAENGIIEEVSCTNFMCHSHLTIKLGPLINFIIGHNGSGKSAVLTALQLCLGGKAASTSRGQNLKAFIKEGRETATLRVKIKNKGPSAFKPEVFGDSITVERRFSRSGATQFFVRGTDKKVQGRNKTDVDDLLDYFTLQLDNPMNVLTQDMARQFLSVNQPKDKYKFFYKGTHLEALDLTYREIESGLALSAVKLQAIAEQVEAALNKYNDARRASARAGSLRRLREEIATFDAQLAWIQVQAKEAEANKIQDELEDIDIRIDELQDEERRASENYADAEKDHETAKAKVDEIGKELEPLEAQKTKVQTVFNGRKRELQDILTQQREIRSNHQGAKRDVKDTEKSIAEEKAKLQSKAGGRLEDLQTKITACEEDIKQQHLERHRIESDLKEAEQRLGTAKTATARARSALDEKETIVQQSRRRIQDIERERSSNSMNPNVEALVGAINRDDGFLEKPVGPVWRHVTLLDPKWSSVLERSFGTALDGFCVTSQADSKRLSKMMRRFNW